ncbi:ubiquinone biosynthesis methyltransferase UbiE [Arthrobacter alpinus]|uniref:Demethylmenaquinone methyltransferase n=1 Tax=Arthrobacter alpinus TaxID=656366 RepID=A0A0M3UGJ5_9MICC|nr:MULTISPECIES: ubiquinone/menaquinone biosynthesis methyltransferase [Arthrobacter]ALE93215.1 ubiquinone biosynthesis methyltransferase UbiE [Arthrobacter alpinus]
MRNEDSNVQATFNGIARRYDLMNKLMTLGSHKRWCRDLAQFASSRSGRSYLDLATGTGVIARAVRELNPCATIIGADFSEAMLEMARQIDGNSSIEWQFADAHELPFADSEFDGVTHGYLLRNVSDLDRVLAEQYRVLKPGGVLAALETSPPSGWLGPFIRLGMRVVVPTLGTLIGRDGEAYKYLVRSTLGFLSPEALRLRFQLAGFQNVQVKPKFMGTNMIWTASKPG